MRCEEARASYLSPGVVDAEAETHVAACPHCFEALEQADPLVAVIREARPEAVPTPLTLSSHVIVGWRRRRRLPWIVGGAVLGAASVGASVILVLVASLFSDSAWIAQATIDALVLSFVGGLLSIWIALRLLRGRPLP